MPAISLGLEEVVERLHQIRRRLNSLSLQHVLYSNTALIVVLGALFVAFRLRATSPISRWYLAGYIAITCAVAVVAAIRLRSRWLSLENVARLADHKAALDSRLATLHSQRFRPQRSRLGGLLLTQTLALGPRWDRSALAPHRVSRSLYLLLASLALLAAASFMPPRPIEPSIAGESPPPTSSEEEPEIFEKNPAQSTLAGMLASKSGSKTGEGSSSAGPAPHRTSAGSPDPGSGLNPRETSREGSTLSRKGPPRIAGAPEVHEIQPEPIDMRLAESGVESDEVQRQPLQRDRASRRAPNQPSSAGGLDPSQPEGRANQAPDSPQEGTNQRARPQPQMGETGDSQHKGGAKPSGKTGTAMNDSLFGGERNEAADRGKPNEPGSFALRLTGISSSSPTSLEPQKERGQETAHGFGLGPSSQNEIAEHQVEDEPLQKNLISPEHESLVQRIFRHD